MLPETSAFSRTLGGVTKIKLDAVTVKQAAFVGLKTHILEKIATETAPLARVQILIDGYKGIGTLGFTNAYETIEFNDSIQNYTRLVEHAKLDPSVGDGVLASWEKALIRGLEVDHSKLQYAGLFGDLLKEWLGSDSDGLKDSEDIQRALVDEQVKDFEDHAFSELETNSQEIEEYLEGLFDSPTLQMELETFRDKVETSARRLRNQQITLQKLKLVAQSVLRTPLLDNDKIGVLKEFLNDDIVLGEVVDVLNRSIASLESWDWDGPVAIDVRRQLNGKYRVYMDEDIVQCLLFQYIGCEWEHFIKEHLTAIFTGSNWKLRSSAKAKAEFNTYGARPRSLNLHKPRNRSITPASVAQIRRYDQHDYFLGLLDAAYDNSTGTLNEYNTESKRDPTRREVNDTLLGILATEIRLNKWMHDRITVMHSDFKWFGPALPHSTIHTVFKFMGAPQIWLNFFEKFLRAPLLFPGPDGKEKKRIRTRGSALAHRLTAVFGETMMFFMDFAVNQKADGLFLYRIHDDLWLFDKDVKPVEVAWTEIQIFAKVMGLEFNWYKTGSVCIGENQTSEILPKGEVQWCLLSLDSTGNFVINQKAVQNHISELKRQLSACNSVLSWTRAWNRYYSAFLPRNFGCPRNVLGAKHVQMVIKAFVEIQQEVFPDHGSVTGYLRSVIAEKFNMDDIPDGWFYWPTRLGGLGLDNPIINLLSVKALTDLGIEGKFSRQMLAFTSEYDEDRKEWEESERAQRVDAPKVYMSYDDYLAGWEEHSDSWASFYTSLQRETLNESPEETADITAALATIAAPQRSTSEPQEDFDSMSVYWKWVVARYAAEMKHKFNGLEAVTPGILPIAMVEAFRSMRIRWEK